MAPAAPIINIGIPEADRANIADGLARVLADTYTLHLKTVTNSLTIAAID